MKNDADQNFSFFYNSFSFFIFLAKDVLLDQMDGLKNDMSKISE